MLLWESFGLGSSGRPERHFSPSVSVRGSRLESEDNMSPTDKETGETTSSPEDKAEAIPQLEGKIASHDKKIAYLFNKLARMDAKKAVEIEAPVRDERIEEMLPDLKRALIHHGLEIAGFNEKGIIKLKPMNEAGFDTLRKLNTLFPISILETYFEQYLK